MVLNSSSSGNHLRSSVCPNSCHGQHVLPTKGCDVAAAAVLMWTLFATPSAAQNGGRIVQYNDTNTTTNDDTQAVSQQAPSATRGDNRSGTVLNPSTNASATRPASGPNRAQGVELIIGGSSKDGAAKKTKLPIK